MKLILSLILICTTISVMAQINKSSKLDDIEPLMNEILETWKAPGFAVAVVHKNELIYAKGFGYRDYEKKLPMNENTLLAIGSCSKAFTASVLGILRDENKLKLSDSPIDYIPELRFFNDELNDGVTIQDMMCHRTGIPRHDFSWYLFPTDSKDSLISRIKYQEPFAGLRERWYYNNFMYLLQGVIGERITGKSWEQNVQTMIFDPLKMERSNFTIEDLTKDNNHALGYTLEHDSTIKVTDYYHIAAMSPAGSINSSVKEMGNWLVTWINAGKFSDQKILPPDYTKEAMSSQMVINAALPETETPDVYFSTYGYGWMMASYKGHYRVEHGGNIDGFSASTAFFPSDSLGIVVLTNQNGSSVPSVVRNTIADRLLDIEPTDWNNTLHKKYEEALKKQKEAEKEAESSQQTGTRPSHILQDFTGIYSNPGYGAFEIVLNNDSLLANFKLNKAWLKHYHYDIFQPFFFDDKNPIDSTTNPSLLINFSTNDLGEIASLKVKVEPTLDPIEFKRTPKEIKLDEAQLKKYEGEYELAGITAKVYTKPDKKLYLYVPGQPEYTLVATAQHKFSVKNLEGYKLEFVEGENELITQVKFIQPQGIFTANKK